MDETETNVTVPACWRLIGVERVHQLRHGRDFLPEIRCPPHHSNGNHSESVRFFSANFPLRVTIAPLQFRQEIAVRETQIICCGISLFV